MEKERFIGVIERKSSVALWSAIVLAWGITRTFFINDFFGKYGVNPIIYFLLDILCSVPFATYSAHLLASFLRSDVPAFRKNVLWAATYFYIPDIYIFIFADDIPKHLFIGLIVTIALFSLITILQIIRTIRSHRGH
jgi:hypothetical protein